MNTFHLLLIISGVTVKYINILKLCWIKQILTWWMNWLWIKVPLLINLWNVILHVKFPQAQQRVLLPFTVFQVLQKVIILLLRDLRLRFLQWFCRSIIWVCTLHPWFALHHRLAMSKGLTSIYRQVTAAPISRPHMIYFDFAHLSQIRYLLIHHLLARCKPLHKLTFIRLVQFGLKFWLIKLKQLTNLLATLCSYLSIWQIIARGVIQI